MDKKGLILLTAIYFVFLSFVYFLIYPRISTNEIILNTVSVIFIILFIVFAVGIVLLLTGKSLKKIYLYPLYNYYIFPLIGFINSFLTKDKRKSWEDFIKLNNSIVKSKNYKNIKNSDMILLLPHCLQNTKCKIRITTSIDNCEECGLCEIGDLKKISREYGIETFVVTGGTLARRMVKEKRPKAIIAVACHHDLKEGIELVYPIPVYGVLNKQPEGPCVNTTVDVEKIKFGLEEIFGIEKI